MKFTVTEQHIKDGKRHLACNCPIALCVMQTLSLSGQEPVKVGATNLWIKGMGFSLSNGVYAFISKFDSRKRVKPFTFELDVPESLLKPE